MLDSIPVSAPAFARANGIDLCYQTFGKPTDPPMVLIMGLAAQMVVWDDDFCRQLAAGGFWVVRFDNRDIGLSTKMSGGRPPGAAQFVLAQISSKLVRAPYTLRDMAKDTVGLMDALGIRSAHVVGVSMGGAIAQELAVHFPSRVKTLTSIMSSTGDTKLPKPEPHALAALMQKTPEDREGYLRRYLSTWAILAGDYFPFDQQRTLRQGEASYARGINPPGVARQMLAIMASGNRTRALRSVRARALVVHGAIDPLVPAEAGRATARATPGATLLLVDGMGHTLPREVWPQVIGAILDHAAAAARLERKTG